MFKDFHLMAIINEEGEEGVELQGIQLHRLQHSILIADWHQQYDIFVGKDERQFSASWELGTDEYFIIPDHELSEDFTEINNIEPFINVEMVNLNVSLIDSITGIVARVTDENNNQIMLFQRFTKNQVIKPGKYFFARENAFVGENDNVLTLRNKLTAVYYIENKTLLVDSIYNAQAFLPSLSKYYAEASKDMIRDTLSHGRIECADRKMVADIAHRNRTMRRQFVIIEEEGVLDLFSAKHIQAVAAEGNIEIQVQNDKIVFPTDNKSIKAVLVCLSDRLVRSLLTNEVHESNSKQKVVDSI